VSILLPWEKIRKKPEAFSELQEKITASEQTGVSADELPSLLAET
jgi:hypothetical protein